MVGHPSLATTSDSQRQALFGLPASRGTDGIHFRGTEGSNLFTHSIVEGLKAASAEAAGLPTGWITQGRRGAATIPSTATPASSTSNQIPTYNRFTVLNC